MSDEMARLTIRIEADSAEAAAKRLTELAAISARLDRQTKDLERTGRTGAASLREQGAAAGMSAQMTGRMVQVSEAAARATAKQSAAIAQASGRYTDINGRLREANGRFVQVGTSGAVAGDRIAAGAKKASASVDTLADKAKEAGNGLRRLVAGLGIGLGLRELVGLSDAATTLSSRLRLVTSSEQERLKVQRELQGVATRSRADISETAELYVKLRQANEGLGYSTSQSTKLTEAFALAVKVSGSSGAGAAAAIQQFGQAVAKGTLSGDEFVTVSENASEVLRILQTETGKSRAELLKMREAGELTAKMVGDALIANLDKLRSQVGDAPRTIADGFTALRNSLIKTIGGSQDMARAAQNIAEGLANVGTFLEDNGPLLLQLGKLAVAGYAGAKAFTAFRGALVALNGLSLAGLASRLNVIGAAMTAIAAGAGAGFIAKGMRDASDAQDRARDVERLSSLPESERNTLARGTVASLSAVDRRRMEVAKLRETVNSEELASEERALNRKRNELIAQQQRLRDAGAFTNEAASVATTVAAPATTTKGKSAAQVAKEARERMLDGLEAAGREITDAIARREINANIKLREIARQGGSILPPVPQGDLLKTDNLSTEKVTQVARESAAKVNEALQALANGLQNTFATGFENLFRRGLSSVNDFARSIRDTILRAFSEILASAITRRLLATLSGLGSGGAGGSSAALASGGGVLGALGSLGGLLKGGTGDAGKIGAIAKGGAAKTASGLTLGSGLLAGGAGLLLGSGIGQSAGTTAGVLGGAASGALSGPLVGGPVGALIGGVGGLIGGLFGGNARKKKQQEAARQLAADSAAFADELIARNLIASGDELGARKLQLVAQQKTELEAARARFGASSREVQKLMDVQKKELDALTKDEGQNAFGTYLAPAGFDARPYRFNAGRPTSMTAQSTITTGPVNIVVPEGTTRDQAQQIVRELQALAGEQGLNPNNWQQVAVQ